jgi:hypothetical protein
LSARLVDDTKHSRSSSLLKGSKDFVDEGSEGVPTPIASDRLAGRRFPWSRFSGKRSTLIPACLRSGAFGQEAKVDSLDGYPDISGIRALNSCRGAP